VWSCVPYLLLSIFADFLHVHPLLNPPRSVATGIVHAVEFAPPPAARRLPDSACAICQWQRVGPRLHAAISAGPATFAPQVLVVAAGSSFHESPVPHPSAFRGPPSLSLS
jgi:hypothetical protein